ncbi:MAG TPA: sigma-54 dependent transcriptional regulator [Candidatus Methylacidiphilales bacterium]|jgi:NtrC-family two-component system response regulator AlgB|nr:sigma-54 dependent transcriptional regulator [Candidatus Methylacidiphilales bacterium]
MNVLIIDDDGGIRQTLGAALESEGHNVAAVANRTAAEKKLRAESFEVAFLDIRLGADNGLDLLPELLRLSPRLAVIVITAYSSIETAVQAIQRGAFDYLAKPFKPAQITQLLERVAKARQIDSRLSDLEGRLVKPGMDAELGTSSEPKMQRLLEIAKKSSSSDASVLLLGESGTGKSVLARQMHLWSARAQEPFVTVSCPSLSRDLLESELFGHMKGAFTGAVATTWGKVAAADRGTLFLDEIGELPLEIQPKLLRLLQEREYERVGEAKIRMADVRVIAATNRNLKEAVARGTFREDLLYRLDVISLELPPLRERPGDLMAIAESLLRQLAPRASQPITGFSERARQAMMHYSWPGNIRELRNMIERATILASGAEIDLPDLPASLSAGPAESDSPTLGGANSLDEIEAEHIKRVLAGSKNLQQAATILKLDPTTLLRKRKSLGLD